MKLLIRPAPFTDESLESYLLRLCQENCYDHLGVLVVAIVNSYPNVSAAFAGALPANLNRINVYHANHSSAKRYRALMELAELTINDKTSIQSLISFRSPQLFSQKHEAIIRQGILVPRLFLREQAVPVCPDCLDEYVYVRQLWHYKIYNICHIHKKMMVQECPECHAAIDYRRAFDIAVCECGFDFRELSNAETANNQSLLSCAKLLAGEVDLVPDVLRDKSISQRFGALLWWYLEKVGEKHQSIDYANLTLFFDYFSNWPISFTDDLNKRLKQAELHAVVADHNRKFADVFGSLLPNTARLPNQYLSENFILCEIVSWIDEQLNTEQTIKIDLLQVSFIEAAVLLSTTITEVYRLMEEGYLKTHCRVKIGEAISPFSTLFRLSDVFELWVCGFQTEQSNQQHFLSKW